MPFSHLLSPADSKLSSESILSSIHQVERSSCIVQATDVSSSYSFFDIHEAQSHWSRWPRLLCSQRRTEWTPLSAVLDFCCYNPKPTVSVVVCWTHLDLLDMFRWVFVWQSYNSCSDMLDVTVSNCTSLAIWYHRRDGADGCTALAGNAERSSHRVASGEEIRSLPVLVRFHVVMCAMKVSQHPRRSTDPFARGGDEGKSVV